MSDPATKESRTMTQTFHLLDFSPLNFQKSGVMEFSFQWRRMFDLKSDEFIPREGQTSGLLSAHASLERSWPALRPHTEGEARPETQPDRAGERRTTDLLSGTPSQQKQSRLRLCQHQPGRQPFLRLVSECPIGALPTPSLIRSFTGKKGCVL